MPLALSKLEIRERHRYIYNTWRWEHGEFVKFREFAALVRFAESQGRTLTFFIDGALYT